MIFYSGAKVGVYSEIIFHWLIFLGFYDAGLEKQGVFGMQDKVDIYILTNDLHGSGIVLRQRDNQDAVVVVIHLLNIRQLHGNVLECVRWHVSHEDGFLNPGTAFALQEFCNQRSYLVAGDVIHDEAYHISGFPFCRGDDVQYLSDSFG